MSVTPEIIAAAQASQAKWGIPAAISLAQYGIESAWGTREPPGSFNGFGIKSVPGQPSVTVPTHEFVGGRYITIDAAFAAYPSVAGSFNAHAELLATSHYYEAARAAIAGGITEASTDAFANALTGVYATAPNYGGSLIALMRSDNLYAYNDTPIAQPIAQPALPGVSFALPDLTSAPSIPSTGAIAPPVVAPIAAPLPKPVVTPTHIAVALVATGVVVAGGATAATQMHAIDLTPILTPIISTAGLILTGFASWALARVAAYAHLSMQSALMQNLLGVVDRGITYGQNQATKLAAQDATINLASESEAQALQYVVNKAPGTAKSLGIDVTTLNGQQHIADLITAKLPAA